MNSRKARYSCFLVCLSVLLGFSLSAQAVDLPVKKGADLPVQMKAPPGGVKPQFIPPPPPAGAAPAIVRAIAVSPTSVRVTWGEATGASEYAIWQAAGAAGPFQMIGTMSTTNPGLPRLLNAGQPPNSTRYYRVTANYPALNPGVSAIVSATTPPLGSNPSGFNAAVSTPGNVTLSWNPITGVEPRPSYYLQGTGAPVSPGGTNRPLYLTGTTQWLNGLPVGTHTWLLWAVYTAPSGDSYLGDVNNPARTSITLAEPAASGGAAPVTGTTDLGPGSVTHCGGDGERACCVIERTPSCYQGLTEVGGCKGNCTCGGPNPLGVFKSSGTCAATSTPSTSSSSGMWTSGDAGNPKPPPPPPTPQSTSRVYKVGAISAWQPAIQNIGQVATKGDKRLEVKYIPSTPGWPQYGVYTKAATPLGQPVGFAILVGPGTLGGGIGFSDNTGAFGVVLAILQPNVPGGSGNVLFRFVKFSASSAQLMDVQGYLTTPNATITSRIFFDEANQLALVVDANRFGGYATNPGRARLLDVRGPGATPIGSEIGFDGGTISATVSKRTDGTFEVVVVTNRGTTNIALPKS